MVGSSLECAVMMEDRSTGVPWDLTSVLQDDLWIVGTVATADHFDSRR